MKARRGAVILEAAVALPLLLIILFGGLEFAWAFTKKVEITNAARVGLGRLRFRPPMRRQDLCRTGS